MHIQATINERTLRRTFREKKPGRYGLIVIDRDLPAFGFTVAKNGTKTFFVRAPRPVGAPKTILGTADDITAAEARETGAMVELEPMSPAERRIIHLNLSEHDGIETESTGAGAARRVQIVYRDE